METKKGVKECGANILLGPLYYYGAHSGYDYNNKCFNYVYDFCNVKMDLSRVRYEGIINHGMAFTGICIPIQGEIPSEVIYNTRKICGNNEEFGFVYYGNEIGVTLNSFIIFLELLRKYYQKDERLENKNELPNLSSKTNSDIPIVNFDFDKVVKYSLSRYLKQDCLLPEYVDLNYLSKASISYYLNNVSKAMSKTKVEIANALEDMNSLSFLAEDLSKDNDYNIRDNYIAIVNNKTDTFMQEFKQTPSSGFGYSIMRRYTISSQNKEINQDYLNTLLQHFFGKVPETLLVRIEHKAISRFFDQYEQKDFDDKSANNLYISFWNQSNGNCIDKNSNIYSLSYGLCDGSLDISELRGDKKTRISTDMDQELILSFLQMINKLINADIKNISKEDNVYTEDNQRKLVPNKKK